MISNYSVSFFFILSLNCFICFSEFEELEAVPTSAVIEGPLEPSFNVPDDLSFFNFFSVSIHLTINHSIVTLSILYHIHKVDQS